MDLSEQISEIESRFPIGKLSDESLIQVIKELLEFKEVDGQSNKILVSGKIYQYLANNYWFLMCHKRFNQVVANKVNQYDFKKYLRDDQNYQHIKIVSEFIVHLIKSKPYQLDKSIIDPALELIFQLNQLEDISALFNLSLKTSCLEIPIKILHQPLRLDLNWTDKEGFTALMYAAKNGINLQFIERLIENGADHTIHNKQGKTAYDLAAYQKVKDYLKV